MGKRVAHSSSSDRKRKRSRSGRKKNHALAITLWSVGGVLVAVIAVVAVLVGTRASDARKELEAAVPLAQQIKNSILSNDTDKVGAQLEALQKHTTAAVKETDDPLWRAAELVPVLGTNLSAFREAAQVIDSVANEGLNPLAELASTISLSSFKPVGGRIDVQPMIDAQPSVVAADAAVREAYERAKSIDTSLTIPQVSEAVTDLQDLLEEASDTLAGLKTAVNLLPDMLGASGPRNYLMIFQNNAEARTLGGIPASVALVHVENGEISLVGQAASQDFRLVKNFTLDPSTLELYQNNLADGTIESFIQHITMIPDFNTTALLAKGMWEAKFGDQIDSVLSFDPVALSYLLAATGDVALPTGDVLTSENAVSLLLSEVYARYPDGASQDAFFAGAAAAVFDKVKQGDFNPKLLLEQMTKASDERRVLVWSVIPKEEETLLTTNLSGVLPLSNKPDTVTGVFFNDFSGGKLAYYLDAKVHVSAPICQAAGFDWNYTVDLSSRVPANADDVLPDYVTGATPDGVMQIDIVGVGPIGGTYDSFTGPEGAYLVNVGIDKDRPVVRIRVPIPPGTTQEVKFIMKSPAGMFGPLQVVTTPLVSDTVVTSETC